MLIIISTGVGLIVVSGLLVKTLLKIRKLNKIEVKVDNYINRIDDLKQLTYKELLLLEENKEV